MIRYLLVAILFISLSAFTLHKFYVSVTQIEYSEKAQSLQITSRIFIDDIEKLLRERYDETITLAGKKEPVLVDTYIEQYVSEKLQIKVNGKQVKPEYIGKEYEDDIMFCYIEIKDVKTVETIEVSNLILFDVFPEQQNIIKTNVKGNRKSVILVKENDKALLNFN